MYGVIGKFCKDVRGYIGMIFGLQSGFQGLLRDVSGAGRV